MGDIEVMFFIRVLSIFYLGISISSGFDPIDNYLIDCGSSNNTLVGDRVFLSDYTASKFLSTPLDVLANTAKKAKIFSRDSPLYQTARIFTQTSTYKFPILHQGRHWIGLYFSPFSYETYDMRNARFSVSSENHVLLGDFCTYDTSSLKEFSVNVTSNSLVITLVPAVNSFAFLNAIEVVSVPDELITDDFVPIVGSLDQTFKGLSSQAFETVARVNMGGPMVFSENDTLWRTWVPDQNFLVIKDAFINISKIEAVKYITGARATPNIALAIVYGTATTTEVTESNELNITWEFEVDPEFCYLIRFHFCDILSDVLGTHYFNVYINFLNVASDVDSRALSSNVYGSPFYLDYVTMLMVTNKLHVSIGPPTGHVTLDVGFLNGLEILKINNSVGNFASLVMSSAAKKNIGVLATAVSIGGCLAVIGCLVFFSIMCKNRERQALKGHSKTTDKAIDALKHGTCIPFLAVQEATNNFDESWVIGNGGFGKVYKGVLNDGTKVAVKRKNPGSQQGLIEFWTEIRMLSQFRHRHLVSLLAYCAEENEMILVYEYMENGTLRSHLHGSELPTLSWKQRLEICIGAARGLHYLHTGFAKAIIHRDVKSANILLDENLKAKVADFGISKMGPDITQADYVSTAVKGSFGYFDPEYFRRRRLTLKSDVYSFGVVLFEVLCGRAAVESTLPTEEIGLAGWALKWQETGNLEEIIDPALKGEIRPDSLKKFGEIAERCLAEFGVNRPSMGEVLQNLECALQLQEAAERTISTRIIDDGKLQHSVSAFEFSSVNVDDDLSGGYRAIKSFSQPMKSEERWLLRDVNSHGLGLSL